MKARLLSVAVLLLIMGSAVASISTSSDYLLDPVPQPQNKFSEMVDIFLLAVDRGAGLEATPVTAPGVRSAPEELDLQRHRLAHAPHRQGPLDLRRVGAGRRHQ